MSAFNNISKDSIVSAILDYKEANKYMSSSELVFEIMDAVKFGVHSILLTTENKNEKI